MAKTRMRCMSRFGHDRQAKSWRLLVLKFKYLPLEKDGSPKKNIFLVSAALEFSSRRPGMP